MAKQMYDMTLITARPSDPKLAAIWDCVESLSHRHGITMPEIGIYQSGEPNAFATGWSQNAGLIAFSTGILTTMTSDELEGVIAHEMAHILNGDMVTMTLLQ
jgi:heat shock protein HtpX